METFILKILTQGSPLVVLVMVVWMFLRFLERTREADREMMRGFNAQHLDARAQTNVALIANADATRRNTEALQALEQTVRSRLTNGNK